jgi:hypothetical protein
LQLDEEVASPQRYVPLPRQVAAGTTRLFVAAGAGWQVGHGGPQPRPPHGYLSVWASTVAYQNSPFDLPPDATLARAGAGAVVVWVGLQPPRRRNPFPVRNNPLDLRKAFCTRAWEGSLPGVTQCTLWSHVLDRFEISVYVYLRQRARLQAAQHELRRLVLPRSLSCERTSLPRRAALKARARHRAPGYVGSGERCLAANCLLLARESPVLVKRAAAWSGVGGERERAGERARKSSRPRRRPY